MDRNIFDDEHEMFRDSVRSFLQNEIQPHSDRWHEQGIVDREAYTKAGEMGLLLMWADEKYGSKNSDGCPNACRAKVFLLWRSQNRVREVTSPGCGHERKTRAIIFC